MERDKQLRQHTLEDGTIITQRLYELESGYKMWCPEKSCVFCQKCHDMFYDYTHGPYAFSCDDNLNLSQEMAQKGYEGKCENFVESDSNDYEVVRFFDRKGGTK